MINAQQSLMTCGKIYAIIVVRDKCSSNSNVDSFIPPSASCS
jgi:hypothetical protein